MAKDLYRVDAVHDAITVHITELDIRTVGERQIDQVAEDLRRVTAAYGTVTIHVAPERGADTQAA